MTASWAAFIVGAALVFLVFNAIFAFFYWIDLIPLDRRSANLERVRPAYIDYFYFSIEKLSAGCGACTRRATTAISSRAIELFTGIFSMSLMTGLISSRDRARGYCSPTIRSFRAMRACRPS